MEDSKRLITHVMNMRPEERAHPAVQADLQQARRVVAEDTIRRLEGQAEPLTEAQQQELAQAQGVLVALGNEAGAASSSADSHGNGGLPPPNTSDVGGPPPSGSEPLPGSPASSEDKNPRSGSPNTAPEQPPPGGPNGPGTTALLPPDSKPPMPVVGSSLDSNATRPVAPPQPQVLNPAHLQPHQDNLARKLAEPRDAQAEAALKADDARLQDPATGTQATRRRIEAEVFQDKSPVGGKHINEANRLKSPNGMEVLHKPAAGQVKDKLRAGIEPETTGKREVAASEVSEMLGFDLVPATTMITHEGQPGSAQDFKRGMVNGEVASTPPHNLKIDRRTQAPVDLPQHLAEDWQLMDDLLMHSDRHAGNYMLQFDSNKKIIGVALVDNGYCLPANTAVVEKRFPGPWEDKPISPLNQARLRRMIENEATLRNSLSKHLEDEAVDGLFARAKALLARGTYGNFKLMKSTRICHPKSGGWTPSIAVIVTSDL